MRPGNTPPTMYTAKSRITAPVWSPDGARIAFANGTIMMITRDGSGLHEVRRPPAPRVVVAVTWAPVGQTILYANGRFVQSGASSKLEEPHISIVSVNGGSPTNPIEGSEPAWRPTAGSTGPTTPAAGGSPPSQATTDGPPRPGQGQEYQESVTHIHNQEAETVQHNAAVGALIPKLPYRGQYVTFTYDVSVNEFRAVLNPRNRDQGLQELDAFLKQNQVERLDTESHHSIVDVGSGRASP